MEPGRELTREGRRPLSKEELKGLEELWEGLNKSPDVGPTISLTPIVVGLFKWAFFGLVVLWTVVGIKVGLQYLF